MQSSFITLPKKTLQERSKTFKVKCWTCWFDASKRYGSLQITNPQNSFSSSRLWTI